MYPASPISVSLDALSQYPLPAPGTDKESRGRVLVIGGSARVPGAVLLSAEAAMRAGAGKLQIGTVATVATAVGIALPEAMVIALPQDLNGEVMAIGPTLAPSIDEASAILIGPGMEGSQHLVGLISELSRSEAVLVLDAGALNVDLAPARAEILSY